MYKTPCCNVPISWWKGILSQPLDPVKCPKCNIKYHDEAKRKHRLLAILLIYTSIVVTIVGLFPNLNHFGYAGIIFLGLSLSILIYDEIIVVQIGELTKTTLGQQKKDLKILMWAGILFVISVFYEIWRAL